MDAHTREKIFKIIMGMNGSGTGLVQKMLGWAGLGTLSASFKQRMRAPTILLRALVLQVQTVLHSLLRCSCCNHSHASFKQKMRVLQVPAVLHSLFSCSSCNQRYRQAMLLTAAAQPTLWLLHRPALQHLRHSQRTTRGHGSIPDISKERAAASSPTEVIAVQAEGTHTNSAPQGTGAASSGSAAQPAQLQRCQEEGQRNNEKRAQTTTSRMCTEKQIKTCWNEVRSERVDRANKEKKSIMAFDKHKEGDSDWCIHLEIEKQVQESLIDVTSDEQENQQSSCAAASQGTSAASSGGAAQPAQLQ
jgi:hypothetical protein